MYSTSIYFFRNQDGSKNDLSFGGLVDFQLNDSVKYLDLSHLKFSSHKGERASETRARYLTRLLSMCPNLTKLSLQGLRIFDRTFNHFLSEKHSLTHLNLFSCSGLVWSDVQTIGNTYLNSKYLSAFPEETLPLLAQPFFTYIFLFTLDQGGQFFNLFFGRCKTKKNNDFMTFEQF